MIGPSTPSTTNSASIAVPMRREPPITTRRILGSISAVGHVDHDVDEHVGHRDHQHGALHDRIVALRDRIEQRGADAGPREHLLDDDRAGEQRAELQARDRDHRQQRVAQRVDEQRRAARARPWRARCARSPRRAPRASRRVSSAPASPSGARRPRSPATPARPARSRSAPAATRAPRRTRARAGSRAPSSGSRCRTSEPIGHGVSIHVPRLTAASTPSGIATIAASDMPASASASVCGSTATIRAATVGLSSGSGH